MAQKDNKKFVYWIITPKSMTYRDTEYLKKGYIIKQGFKIRQIMKICSLIYCRF